MSELFKAIGGCRCETKPVRFQYRARPIETHYCLCTDCTDTCGGALALIAVVELSSFEVTAGASKVANFDTKPTCHRKYCKDCGCHMYLEVDAFPEFILVHVPTLDRSQDVGTPPDRWVFTDSRHPMIMIPDDGLPRYPGWQVSTKLRRVVDNRPVSAVVTVTAKPGMEKTLEEVLRTLTVHSHNNIGCMNYEIQRDVHNRRTFVISETWSNRDTFEAHGVSPYMDVYKKAVAPLVEARGANVTQALK
jgi:quinol monooxygenase YgiN